MLTVARRFGPLFLLSLLALAGPASSAVSGGDPFARLTGLAGDWVLLDDEGNPTDLTATYRLAAGGAAVIETLLAGTAEETVTVYHPEGGRVTATQVSARGDPVRLLPVQAPTPDDPDAMRLEAAKVKPKGGELGGLAMTFLEEGRLRIGWTLGTEDGGLTFRFFELRREDDVASLQRELDRRLRREVAVEEKGEPKRTLLQTRTLPPGPGWSVSGVPLRQFLHRQTTRFASTYASQGDRGMTVAHYGFRAGPGCRIKFSVLGGHAYIAVVLETRTPPRRVKSVPEFAVKIGAGECGRTVERVTGQRWTEYAGAVEWDLSEFEGKSLRLYVVDDKIDHYGQISISEVSITERAPK